MSNVDRWLGGRTAPLVSLKRLAVLGNNIFVVHSLLGTNATVHINPRVHIALQSKIAIYSPIYSSPWILKQVGRRFGATFDVTSFATAVLRCGEYIYSP